VNVANFKSKVFNFFKRLITRTLAKFGYLAIQLTEYSEIQSKALSKNYLELIAGLHANDCAESISAALKAKSQLGQDLFVLSQFNFERDGFFVEFGATNGRDLSNTYLLEKEFGWRGILAEPAKIWHTELSLNRSARIDFNCVWKATGKTLVFNETRFPELSTIEAFNESDMHNESRDHGKSYKVSTISLLDLLRKHEAPKVIDYLSLDTEGSELEILEAFDFSQYEIKVITVEHNYTSNRDKIYDLLTSHGYARKCEEFSQFDDWYVFTR
jgi:FkbM family methyltransferase